VLKFQTLKEVDILTLSNSNYLLYLIQTMVKILHKNEVYEAFGLATILFK